MTRNITRHLPYSTFFSLHLSLYPSQCTFSHTPSLCFTPFSRLFISLSITTHVHSSFISSFNYSVHQFLLFFLLFCQPSLTLQSSILPHTPSLCFTPFSVLLSVVSLFTLSLLSLSMALFTLLSFFLSLLFTLFLFLTFAFHALVF